MAKNVSAMAGKAGGSKGGAATASVGRGSKIGASPKPTGAGVQGIIGANGNSRGFKSSSNRQFKSLVGRKNVSGR